jgi:hypothetical protein
MPPQGLALTQRSKAHSKFASGKRRSTDSQSTSYDEGGSTYDLLQSSALSCPC